MKNSAIIKEALRKNFFLEGDGHGVYEPEFYIRNGFPEEFVQSLVHKHGGGSHFKEQIDGDPNKIITGVYNLDMLYRVASLLGAKGSTKMGRGFQARELVENIKAVL